MELASVRRIPYFLFATIASLAGCADGPAGVASPVSGSLPQTNERVQFDDASAKRLVVVLRADTERLTNGLLRVTILLRNKTSRTLWTDICTSFRDADGKELERTTWEPTLLTPQAATEYACTSTSAQAADYRVVVRKPARSLGVP